MLGNVTFSNNSVEGGTCSGGTDANISGSAYGGALYSSGGVITANNLLVINNSASGGQLTGGDSSYPGTTAGSAFGGALYLASGVTAISNSVFSNNVTTAGSGNAASSGSSEGGSIFNAGSALLAQTSLSSSLANGASATYTIDTFSQASSGMGGAVYNTGDMQVTGMIIANNNADGGSIEIRESGGPAPGMGGAMYNTGKMQIMGTTISSNEAIGGAIEIFENLTVADGRGGAIYNTGSLEIENTTLSGNSANGGAAYADYYPPGNGLGGAIVNSGFVQISSAVFSSNVTSGATNIGEAIYSTGIIQSDTNSTLTPYMTGTPPLTFQWQTNGNNITGDTNSTFNLGNVQFANAETYDLVISNGGGLVTNFEEIVNQPPPPLTISSVTPNTGFTNSNTLVTIVGTSFTSGATVYFGNTASPYISALNSTNITAYTPASAFIGAVNVVVTNGDFQPVVLTNGFTYLGPPTITLRASLSPGQGVQFQLVGIPTNDYVLLATTNLTPPIVWRPIVTNPAGTNGVWTFIDTNALAIPARYYRAWLP